MIGKSTSDQSDMLSAVDLDEIIKKEAKERASMTDSKGNWYLAMSEDARRDMAKSMANLSQAICGKSKEEIIDCIKLVIAHIDERFSGFESRFVDKKYLKNREDELYMPTLEAEIKSVLNDIVTELSESHEKHIGTVQEILTRISNQVVGVTKQVGDVTKQVEGVTRQVDGLAERVSELDGQVKENRRITDGNTYEISILKQGQANQSLHNDQQMAMMKMVHSGQESLRDLIEAKFESSKPAKQSFWSKLPVPVWVAIMGAFTALAAGTAAAVVYLVTGQIINFGG